ncbi:MAG: hypothetical protein QOJ93_3489 [Actinomycetota bacterium]|jgi:hypothetical protein|nr:hypothetical protein [Actinomycetota bacterium]
MALRPSRHDPTSEYYVMVFDSNTQAMVYQGSIKAI